MSVPGAIEYFYIEENGDFFHVISQEAMTFTHDSLKSIVEEEKTPELKIPRYSWSQDEDSLTVWVKIPEKDAALKANVQVSPMNILVSVGDSVLIQGDTPNKVQADLVTWNRKEETLEIDLPKQESGLMWSELLKGDTDGEMLANPALAAEIHAR